MRVVVEDVGEPEGPVFAPDGGFYVTEMAAGRSCVSAIVSGERHRLFRTAGRPNGLAIDGDGNMWVAEARDGSLIKARPDGTILKVIRGDAGGRFLWPNDIAFGPDGMLYLTDSGIDDRTLIPAAGIRGDFATLDYDGRLYRIDPASGHVELLDRGFRFTNGIAFGPDDRLYINETVSGSIYCYDLQAMPPRRILFANVLKNPGWGQFGGPDGMKFDTAGYLYCAVFNQGDVTVLAPDGSLSARLDTSGARPTNLAFHPAEAVIYVTEVEHSRVMALDVPRMGLPLHRPRISA